MDQFDDAYKVFLMVAGSLFALASAFAVAAWLPTLIEELR